MSGEPFVLGRQAGYDPDDTAWTARSVFGLEAGEELSRFVADLTRLVTPPR